jgi:hypothetical protein
MRKRRRIAASFHINDDGSAALMAGMILFAAVAGVVNLGCHGRGKRPEAIIRRFCISGGCWKEPHHPLDPE